VSDVLLRDRRDAVEVLTLNRPTKRNALNLELVQALHRAIDDLNADRELTAVVVTGAGEHFMAGADIAQLLERNAADALDSLNGALFTRLEELAVPVVAAVQGYALGGGCELAMACDIRVAGRSARFGQPEVGLGIVPGAGATYRLPRLIGLGRAKELILTGRLVTAEEALAMGLVNRVVEDAAVLTEALALAGQITAQGREAVRLAKLALNTQRHGTQAGAAMERAAQARLYETSEKTRRMTAFLNRRRNRR
jgi:enoyl-CoA hydratase/carnithine racemase